jgi:hypothetical protein
MEKKMKVKRLTGRRVGALVAIEIEIPHKMVYVIQGIAHHVIFYPPPTAALKT